MTNTRNRVKTHKNDNSGLPMLINRLMHCGSAHNANRRSEWPLRESHIHSQALLLAMSVLGIYRFLWLKHSKCCQCRKMRMSQQQRTKIVSFCGNNHTGQPPPPRVNPAPTRDSNHTGQTPILHSMQPWHRHSHVAIIQSCWLAGQPQRTRSIR